MVKISECSYIELWNIESDIFVVKLKFELFFRQSRAAGQTFCFEIPLSKIALLEILIIEYENLILGGAILGGKRRD